MKVATTRAELHIIWHKSIQVVAEGIGLENYRKIPKISPGAYIFKALFEGLIFGGAYFRRYLSTEGNLRLKIDWARLIFGSKFTVFALFYFVFGSNFSSTSPRGLIFGGAI